MTVDIAAVHLADELMEQIRVHRLKPGMLVASEQVLRSRHDIGRSVLRQAARILEERGVAVMRRGSGGGLIVAEPTPEPAGRALAIVIESRLLGPKGLDRLIKANDTHVFMAATPKLDLAACEKVRRLAVRLTGAVDDPFRQADDTRQLVAAVRGMVRDPLAGLAYQTMAEFGEDLTPYSVRLNSVEQQGVWWGTLLQMVEAQIGGDVSALFEARRRQLEVLTESQQAWSTIDRDRRLIPVIEEGGAATGQSPADRLVRELLRDVRLQGWPAGARLGGARELMQRYKVTVGTLRQAVRTLEQHSVVRMELGRAGGLFITMPDPDAAITRAVAYLNQSDLDLADVISFRRQLVLEAISCAAERKLPSVRITAALEGDPATLYARLGALSGDMALETFLAIVSTVAPHRDSPRPDSLPIVLDALCRGDTVRARRAFLNYDVG
jgi:DNA-binding FadR family transcriptional regulator